MLDVDPSKVVIVPVTTMRPCESTATAAADWLTKPKSTSASPSPEKPGSGDPSSRYRATAKPATWGRSGSPRSPKPAATTLPS